MAVFALAATLQTIRVSGISATKYRIVQASDGTTVVSGPVTTGITSTGTLHYKATATMPSTAGDYQIQWDDGTGVWTAVEDLTIENTLATTTAHQLKPPV